MRRVISIFILGLGLAGMAQAQDAPTTPPPSSGKKVQVKQLKEQYWSETEEADVVQNRLYGKKNRVELSLFGGKISSDPFLTVKNFGGSLGYHFNESVSLHLVGWKAIVSGSDALETLEKEQDTTANTNKPKSYLGLEGDYSFIYGKLSLLGKTILYFDMLGLVGLGSTSTENGSALSAYLGLSQRIFLSKGVALRLDYRLMHYKEKIIGREDTNKGDVLDQRSNWSDVITVGFSFFI